MYEVKCLDSRNNTINYFTQWDINQTIYIKMDDLNFKEVESGSPSYAYPEVHFCNSKMDERYIVRSSSDDNCKTIKVSVPNILLQEPYPILIYVYMVDSDDLSSQRTVLRNEIPVRKAAKPSDYCYVENIDKVTARMIAEEIEEVVYQEKEDAIIYINDQKDIYISDVEKAKTTAITNITTTTSNAQNAVNNQMNKDYDGGFVNVGNDIISELNKIKEDSQNEYNKNNIAASDTQRTIEESVSNIISEEGLVLDTKYNDSTGNVDVVIMINQQTAFIL